MPLVAESVRTGAAVTVEAGNKERKSNAASERTEASLLAELLMVSIFTFPLFVVGLTFGYRLGYCHYSITITKTST
jgi:hypothetical protein